jgi:hypothetical protein
MGYVANQDMNPVQIGCLLTNPDANPVQTGYIAD